MEWAHVLFAAAFVAGCTGGKSERVVEVSDTLIFGRGGDSVGLDPAHEDDGESFKVCNNIYDTLVRFKDGSTELEPGLATHWDASSDGLIWTFHLREGVVFHDNTPCDAQAVVASLKRQMDIEPPHRFHKLGGPFKYWQNMGMDDVVGDIEATGSHTVVFRLKKQSAPFVANLAMNFSSIVSPTALDKWGDDYARHPVGTGPYRFVEWIKDDRVVLERNEAYWAGSPPIRRVVFRSIPENSVRFIALRNGDVHGIDGIVPDDVEALKADPRFQLLSQPGMNVGYLAMNCDKAPFDDVRVRRAVNHAINRPAIIHALYRGLATAAVNPLPPTVWSYHEGLEPYGYDPERARALLAEAGLADGFDTDLWAMPVPRPYMPDATRLAQAIQADLNAVGIRAEIVTYEWGTYLDYVQRGKHEMCLLGWTGDNGDPDNFLYTLLDAETAKRVPSQNVAFYKNDEVHELLIEAQRSPDHDLRVAHYRRAQELIHADAPWCPIAHSTQLIAFDQRVKNYILHPTGQVRFRAVTFAGTDQAAAH